jgi:predicted SAM-dependent methyltransferase
MKSSTRQNSDAAARKERKRAAAAIKADPSRLGPHQGGIQKINVGSGPDHIRRDWWNVDLLDFKTIDEAMDATKPWPWQEISHVFAEHFIEHLSLADAIKFLTEAGKSLRQQGRIRLSTPSVEYVVQGFRLDVSEEKMAEQTLGLNRSFHGWSHQFLYSKAMLRLLLEDVGYSDVKFFGYGESDTEELRGLERHKNGRGFRNGIPGVWIVEGEKRGEINGPTEDRMRYYYEIFVRYLGRH